MEAEPHSSLRRLRLQTAGSASASGGASCGVCRVRDVSCSLGRLPTGDAADVRCSGTGWAHGGAYGSAGGGDWGGVCGGDAAGVAHGAGVCCSGGRHHAISSSLRWLPTGDDAGDCHCGSGSAGVEMAGQVAVEVAVIATVRTVVQVAGLSREMVVTSPSPGGSVP
ncbi:hypothetical protein NDU88_003720 [Pleurodeles waltl]|uniref:Uncharacterized protein n=1 Tax=Pleurodeles waltl TaxID=8319 RepID=A0AAV7VF02_PLEWA|nr:hypothetical protein NDU88_003720 [Pleurodeles waltl]